MVLFSYKCNLQFYYLAICTYCSGAALTIALPVAMNYPTVDFNEHKQYSPQERWRRAAEHRSNINFRKEVI